MHLEIFRGILSFLVYNYIETQFERGGILRETEIIKMLLKRDEKGLESLLIYYGPLIKYIIAPILHNAQDREECLSEVTMRVWEKIDRFDREKGSFKAWLTSIARYAAINRTRNIPDHTSVDELSENTPSFELTPEEAVIRQDRKNAVVRALQRISPEERILFYRKYYYLQPTSPIASELGMTERAVEGKLYRLKKRLRKILGGESNG